MNLIKTSYQILRDIKPQLSSDNSIEVEKIVDKVIAARSNIIKEAKKANLTLFHFSNNLDRNIKFDKEFIPSNWDYTITPESFPYSEPIRYIDTPRLHDQEEKSILYLGTPDVAGLRFIPKTLEYFMNIEHDEYFGSQAICALDENRILLKNVPKGVKYLKYRFVIDDPRDLPDFDIFNSEVVFPESFINRLLIIVKKDILESMGLSPDHVKNEVDDSYNVPKQ